MSLSRNHSIVVYGVSIFLECPIGYHRKNCSEKCSYPTYGADCQTVCNCHSDDCHFVSGCYQYGGKLFKIYVNCKAWDIMPGIIF